MTDLARTAHPDEPSGAAEQLTFLPSSTVPVQFRLDQRTRQRGLANIAAIRQQLAALRDSELTSTEAPIVVAVSRAA